jgi:UDP-glucose 4-epimerase
LQPQRNAAVKVLVTGGAGFIGSEVVRQLAATEVEIVVVDNMVNGQREHLAEVESRVDLVEADIRDHHRMSSLMKGANVVYHLACLGVRHSIHSPRENHEVNATGTLGLLEIARAAHVGRFVMVSTSEVYGTARTVPMDEQHPTFPHTVYGASKLAGECYARAFAKTYGYSAVVVRPFNTYGPFSHHDGDSGEVIPIFMLRCLDGRPLVVFGDGTQTRDFTFVSDTARGIIMAGAAPDLVGQTINLGSGKEIAIRDLASAVADAAGAPPPTLSFDEPRPGDVMRLYADISKAREVLGFEPQVSLGEGLTILRDWYRGLERAPASLLEQTPTRNWVLPETSPHAR